MFFSQAIAQGSSGVAFFFASSELMMNGTTTATLNSNILSLADVVDAEGVIVYDHELFGFSSEPADIWNVGKPPTLTALSNDHLTSFAVTGLPS